MPEKSLPKNWFFLLLFFLLAAGCVFQKPVEQIQQKTEQKKTEPDSLQSLCFESGKCIKIERATTPQQHSFGLMFRESLPENAGMLFLFEETRPRAFWMKNTLISLDLVWIDDAKTIVGITQNVQPCKTDPCATYPSDIPVKYVLEINAGGFSRFGLKIGQIVDFLD